MVRIRGLIEMPRYVVRVLKREVVVLSADVTVKADSKEAARAKVTEMHRDDTIDVRLWYEEDVWYTDDPLEIKEVRFDSFF